MVVETVKVVRKNHPFGYVVINKDELKTEDVLYKEPKYKRDEKKCLSNTETLKT